MRLIALTTAMLSVSGGALADNGTANLREALGLLPDVILTNPAPDLAYFIDVSSLHTLPEAQADDLVRHRADMMLVGLRPIEALRVGGVEGWSEKAGLDIAQVRYFAGFGPAPYTVSIWGLDGPASAEGLLAVLEEGEFEPTSAGGLVGGLANGAPLALDLVNRDPASPWRGPTGQTSFVAARDNALIQAAAPEAVAFVQHAESIPSAADHPVVATALGALDEVAGEAWIAQALLVSPSLGLAAVDPAGLMAADINEIRRKLEESLADAGQGIPPYFGGILADVQLGDRPALVIALTFPDCEVAETAVAMIKERWNATLAEQVPAEIGTRTVPGTEGTCGGAVTIAATDETATRNTAASVAMGAIMRREFSVLQIGTPAEQ